MSERGVHVSISIFGEEQIERELLRVAHRGTNMKPAFRAIFDRLMDIEEEQFLSEGARGGHPWAPRQDPTDITPLLYKTGDLFESLTSPHSSNNETIMTDDWAVFRVTGDPGEYGAYHQSGTSKMPARPPFQLTSLDREEFVKIMQRYVMTGEIGVGA
jgi:phage gpG-like protein